jgi:hypothetical protein
MANDKPTGPAPAMSTGTCFVVWVAVISLFDEPYSDSLSCPSP